MKTRFLIIALISFVFISCKNESEPSVKFKEDTVEKNDNNVYLEEFALLLSKSINKDKSLLADIQEETKKQFDGDYNLLFAKSFVSDEAIIKSAYQQTNGNNSVLYAKMKKAVASIANLGIQKANRLRQTNEFDILIDKILQKEPLLNIYMPDWGDLSKYDDFLIVILPKNVSDKEGFQVTAYNKKGDKIILSSKEEPKVPYLVIGKSERVFTDKEQLPINRAPFLSTSYNKYYKRDLVHINKKQEISSSHVASAINGTVRKRDWEGGNSSHSEVIKSAAFVSEQALWECEAWLRGQPEVECQVYYKSKDNESYNKYAHVRIPMNNDRWYKGNKFWGSAELCINNGNWNMFIWNKKAVATSPLILHYIELDDNPKLKITYSKVTVDLSIESGGDYIGQADIYFSDPLGMSYVTYGNKLRFVVDREKVNK